MKKLLPFILSLAIICSMVMIPASVHANMFSDSLFFDANYTTGSYEDAKGKAPVYDFAGKDKLPECYSGEDVEFVDDTTTGLKVMHIRGAGLAYDIDLTKVMKNFTMEIYFKPMAAGWAMICGTYYNNNNNVNVGWGLQMGAFDSGSGPFPGIGVTNNLSITEANGTTHRNSPALYKKAKGSWTHVVYANDGTTSSYYVNGELKASEACFAPGGIPGVSFKDQSNAAFRIGGYRPQTDQMCMEMYCAYCRIYAAAASATDVTALYAAKDTGKVPDIVGGDPTPTATPEVTPSEEPGTPTFTPAPGILKDLDAKTFFDVEYSTGTMDDQTGNYTFNDQISGCDPVTFVDDEVLGKKVLEITEDNQGTVTYEHNDGFSFLGYDLTEGLTLETYVYISTDPIEVKHNLGIIGVGYGYFGFSEYNDQTDYMCGFTCGDGNSEANYNMGLAFDTEHILPHKEWIHLVGTSDEKVTSFYLNGKLVATYDRNFSLVGERYNTRTSQINLADSIYGGMWGDFHVEGKYSFAKIYKACANGEQVAALYDRAVNGGSEPGGPTPSATPEEPISSPTPTPEPTPEVEIPAGDAYKTTIEDTPAFKAGDKAIIPLKINGINVADGIMGFDIGITLNSKLVKTDINDEMIQEANKDNASLAALNGEGGKWSVLGRSEDGKLLLTIFDENAATVAKAENEIIINIPVEAIADSQEGDWIGYISDAEGTSGKVETIEGSGTWAMVAAPVAPVTDEPTPSETPTSSSEVSPSPDTPASPSPSPSPVNPLNPTTFDPGMASLVAVVLSSLVLTKSRKKKDEE